MSENIKTPQITTPVQSGKQVSVKKVAVSEIFGPTIEGEGAVIGIQTFFIRFAGCDYRCGNCDSLHAVLPEHIKAATKYTMQELTDTFSEFVLSSSGEVEWVTFSGGNPCIWDLTEFVRNINSHGTALKMKIAVETQGTFWQDWLRVCDHVTVSPKGPGMEEKFEPLRFGKFIQNLIISEVSWNIKVVCFDQRDIEFTKELVRTFPTIVDRLFLSVGNNDLPEQGISKQDLVDNLLLRYRVLIEEVANEPLLKTARILPQMHVLLWGNELGR